MDAYLAIHYSLLPPALKLCIVRFEPLWKLAATDPEEILVKVHVYWCSGFRLYLNK